MHDTATRIACARWFVKHNRRWPLCLVSFIASGLVLYSLLDTLGRLSAQKRLPRSQAAVDELKPKSVPDEKNAAIVWTRAMGAMPSESAVKDKVLAHSLTIGGMPVGKPTLFLKKAEWQSRDTYLPDSAVRMWLSQSNRAFELADSAATMQACNWEFDRTALSPFGLTGMSMRDLVRPLAARARIAAFDNQWAIVEQSFRVMARNADHLLTAPSEMNVLVAISIDAIIKDALEDCLTVTSSPVPLDVLRRLRQFCLERHNSPLHLADAHEIEKRMELRRIDMSACDSRAVDPFDTSPARVLLDYYPLVCTQERDITEHTYDDFIASDRELESTGILRHVDTELIYHQGRLCLLRIDIIPLSDRIKGTVLNDRAEWRVAMFGLAALEYHATHDQKWPSALEETGLDATLLKDPSSDTQQYPLLWKIDPKDNALFVWSVGHEGKDSSGLDLKRWREDNIVFRVPSVPMSREPKSGAK